MKLDPHGHEQLYLKWKTNSEIKGVSEYNRHLIVEYLTDMETGLNVTRCGSLGFARLNTIRHRMSRITRLLETRYEKQRIIDISEREIVSFFKDLREGRILSSYGRPFDSWVDYVKAFKALWHWYQRIENSKGNSVSDITLYIDTRPTKENSFVYFTIDDLRRMTDQAKFEYRVMMWFIFDCGIRAPTELMNIKLSDLSPLDDSDDYQLDIRDEISKTFGRKVKLVLCSQLLKTYIQEKRLRDDDYLFPITPRVVNQYLKRLAIRVFGDVKTKAGKYVSQISMYDFRHSSACYWFPRYKSESGLKYRFGWKKTDQIHYYTKRLGMQDTICKEDLLIGTEAKTELENELANERKKKHIADEQLQMYQDEIDGLKEQLAQSESRDTMILQLLKSLMQKGRGDDIVQSIHEEKLTELLVKN